MNETIEIKKKTLKRGEDGSTVISIRLKDELVAQLDDISAKSNRSRNELIGLLLIEAVKRVKVTE